MRRTLLLYSLLCIALLLAGCMGPNNIKRTARGILPSEVTPRFSSQSDIYWDQWVRKGEPYITMQPEGPPLVKPTAVFMPFRPLVDFPEAAGISQQVSRQLWQTWLKEGVFPVLEFADYTHYYTQQRAVQLARQRGADLAIGGYVTRYLDGGTVGDTQVAVQIEILDAATGQLIWAMADAGLMQHDLTRDFIFFAAKTRFPGDPTWAILQAIGNDTALPLKAWQAELNDPKAAAKAAPAM